MGKSIFYKLFRLGRFPKAMVPILESEGIVLQDQGVWGSVTFRKFRAPGKIYNYRKSGFVGSVVITELRFAAFAFSKPLVNLPLEKEKLELLDLSVPKRNQLLVNFNAGDFHEGWKGTLKCRFSTELADMFLDRLTLPKSPDKDMGVLNV